MSVSDGNRSLVRRFYEEVVNTGDVTRVDGFLAPDYAEVFEGKRYAIGIEGAKAHISSVRSALARACPKA